jgi:hypothetical protein
VKLISSSCIILYECDTWSLTLREEHRLRVFKYRVPSKVFVPKRQEVRGDCRELHEELRDLCSSLKIIHVVKSNRISGWGMLHV